MQQFLPQCLDVVELLFGDGGFYLRSIQIEKKG